MPSAEPATPFPSSFCPDSPDVAGEPSAEAVESYPGIAVDKRLRTGLKQTGPKAKPRNSRGTASAWSTATVPQGFQWVGRKTKRLWAQGYDGILATYGSVTFTKHAILQSIVRLETIIQMHERFRRDRMDAGTMKDEMYLAVSDKIAKTTAARDRMILSLGLDANSMDVFGLALEEDPNDVPPDDGSMLEGEFEDVTEDEE